MAYTRDPVKFFFDNIFYSPDGCWYWTGYALKSGYGQLSVNNYPVTAHTFSYKIHKGDTAGLCVRHSCDQPICVNPDHLLLGTKGDNSRDMKERKRSTIGVKNSHAKLDDTSVSIIREAVSRGFKVKDLARYFKMSGSQVRLIKNGGSWKHVC
jgi:hypothetical protein